MPHPEATEMKKVPAEEGEAVVAGDAVKEPAWNGTTYSCFDDMCICCYGCWCGLCAYCEVGCDAYDHTGDSQGDFVVGCIISVCLSAYCWPCTLCCCPDKCIFCFNGLLLGRYRNKYGLPKLPEGEYWCKGSGTYFFSDCCQMFYCCGRCTVCLMYKTSKHAFLGMKKGNGDLQPLKDAPRYDERTMK
eukprot:CAMPEP_0197522476 /NCGR_PEP_ID=MMETSP1318-20131121/7618_1 /TAXON_ID=552666 /ORGANISM="Partenskyella glossopodia, Strain RCC365" /LENGTH=187 /DNA_ID=CAMNT_0043074873 /DNA_START=96 /DNA_END=659 /DNA_ORIENTATION=-